MNDFQQHIAEHEFNTIAEPVVLRGFGHCHDSTVIKEGFFMYKSATENSYYNATDGVLYVMRIVF